MREGGTAHQIMYMKLGRAGEGAPGICPNPGIFYCIKIYVYFFFFFLEMVLGFQGSVIKTLIVGFEFVCVSNSFVSLGIGNYAFICQVKDSSNSTVFNFHCSWFSKIKVRRHYH